MSTKKLIGRECKHVIYVPSSQNEDDDAVFVKEYLHYDDGTTEPSIAFKKNYEQPFYITKENFRNHKDKKESELLSRLSVRKTNRRTMLKKIARTLGKKLDNLNLRRLAQSQYLYGADITVPAIVKHEYLKRWPECSTESKVAVLDIETDVVMGTEEILSCTVSFKDRVFLGINKNFVKGIPNVEDKIQKAFEKYLGKFKASRNITLTIELFDTPGMLCERALHYGHEWKPDFMAVWNIDFDLPKILNALEKEHYDIAKVFSDPSIPPEFRYAEYTPGPKVKVSASGRNMPLSPDERWNVMLAPSTFYWIDAMVVYAMIRKAKGRESSYALDAILKKEKLDGKLKFDVADGYVKLAWHVFMQSNYKIEYLIYNIFDCIAMELLDEKTKDLAITLGELCGFSEYQHFNSTPKQLADDLHFFYLERGRVISCISNKMDDELDQNVVSMAGWIITLPTHLVAENGLKVLEDFPDFRSYIFAFVSDLDIKSSYPNTEILCNISRATTMLELCHIEGVSEEDRRVVGLNVTAGEVNAVEFCTRVYKLPELVTLGDAFMADLEVGDAIEYSQVS